MYTVVPDLRGRFATAEVSGGTTYELIPFGSATVHVKAMRIIAPATILSLAMTTGVAGQFDAPPGMPGGGPPTGGMPMTGNTLVQVRAAATVKAIHPGETFHLAFTYRIAPAWHIYWLNPGDSGAPTGIFVDAPEGFEVGDVLWPRPEVITGEMLTYGYEDTVTLFVPVTAPTSLDDGEAVFSVELDWLVCREQCLMGDSSRTIRVPMRSGPAVDASADRKPGEEIREKDWRAMYERVPAPLQGKHAAKETKVSFDGAMLTITAPARGFESASWLPVPGPGVSYGEATIDINDNRVTATIPVTIDERAAMGRPMRLEGVLALGERPDDPGYHLKRPVDASNPTN